MPHIVESIYATLFAIVLLFIIVFFARKVGEHFHHRHTHEGDSNLDSSIGFSLITANILHPLVDGFALYSIYSLQGSYLFISVFVGILIHEIFRQSALVVVFKEFGFQPWKVILPAIVGMAFGWLIGVIGGNLPDGLEPYIDTLTFGAYTFIVAEYFFAHKDTFKNRRLIYFLFLGILMTLIFVNIFRAH